MTATSPGICQLCGHRTAKSAITRHLAACLQEHDGDGPVGPTVQIKFESAGQPYHWLVLEARSDATLGQVDELLRTVWLECCGHLSAFRVNRDELGMHSKVGAAFRRKGMRFQYEYDFGSTTALTGSVLGTRPGRCGRSTTRLLARNEPISWKCDECEDTATVVCPLCLYSEPALFCDAHAGHHACAQDEVFLPVVNSPRMGICAYTGG